MPPVHGLYTDQESFAVKPVPLDHDDREQDTLTADTPHERSTPHPGWARGGMR